MLITTNVNDKIKHAMITNNIVQTKLHDIYNLMKKKDSSVVFDKQFISAESRTI